MLALTANKTQQNNSPLVNAPSLGVKLLYNPDLLTLRREQVRHAMNLGASTVMTIPTADFYHIGQTDDNETMQSDIPVPVVAITTSDGKFMLKSNVDKYITSRKARLH
jgi:hypothetical protein